MAFVRFGPLIVEVAEAGGPARFWGLTVAVDDLDAAAGPLLGTARGRRSSRAAGSRRCAARPASPSRSP